MQWKGFAEKEGFRLRAVLYQKLNKHKKHKHKKHSVTDNKQYNNYYFWAAYTCAVAFSALTLLVGL